MRRYSVTLLILSLTLLFCPTSNSGVHAGEPINIWPDLAPGETTRLTGEALPRRPAEVPPVTRLINITRPTVSVFPAAKPNGTGLVILPGGGFGKIVPDKEGSEAAVWLNKHGVTVFVLNYRTTSGKDRPGWVRALQDAQRTMALVRANAKWWSLEPDRIGLLGFSAGGQVAARLLSDDGELSYDRVDATDDISHRPDFALLIYPWNIYDTENDSLVTGVTGAKNCPPTFLVHTHDDRSSSLGTVYFYAGLKRHKIPAELHVYGNGGHGYGLRDVKASQISSWPGHAAHWLGARGFLARKFD
jgi:acetyl esterase/lipase